VVFLWIRRSGGERGDEPATRTDPLIDVLPACACGTTGVDSADNGGPRGDTMSVARSIRPMNGESTTLGSPAVRAALGPRVTAAIRFPGVLSPSSTTEIRWVLFMGRPTQRPAFWPLPRRVPAGSLLSSTGSSRGQTARRICRVSGIASSVARPGMCRRASIAHR
jgi:hypothetical protein